MPQALFCDFARGGQVQKQLDMMDENGDGSVSRAEFDKAVVVSMMHVPHHMRVMQVMHAFVFSQDLDCRL